VTISVRGSNIALAVVRCWLSVWSRLSCCLRILCNMHCHGIF